MSVEVNRVVKEGYITKLAVKSGRNWKKRFFVLRSDCSLAYSTEKGEPEKRRVQLDQHSTVRLDADSKEAAEFIVEGPNHDTLVLRTSSVDESNIWIKRITQAIEALTKDKSAARVDGMSAYASGANKALLGGRGRGRGRGKAKKKTGLTGMAATMDAARKRSVNLEALKLEEEAKKKKAEDEAAAKAKAAEPKGVADLAFAARVGGGSQNFAAAAATPQQNVRTGEKKVKPPPEGGWTMNVGATKAEGKDVFVDAITFAYYSDKAAFDAAEKPLGKATLELLV